MSPEWLHDLSRLAAALVAGGAIGLDRQLGGRPAGLRTHMLVAVGSALVVLMIASVGSSADVSRVIQGVLTGIGFLCAGEILHRMRDGHEHVKGLTSAASLWVTAAIGMASGLGLWRLVASGSALTLIVLIVIRRFEPWRRPSPEGGPAEGGPAQEPTGPAGARDPRAP
jgi:putative Mg2+ transporter-C (MgtC) family protein